MQPPLELPAALRPLIEALHRGGVRPVVVGGFVRDVLLGREGKDIDLECFGPASLDALAALLSPFGKPDRVGSAFGVLKLRLGELEIDLALPRTETKTGSGHTGFDVRTFAAYDFKKAAFRRDFTVNAIGYDPLTSQWLDPYGGREDLRARRLRCVNPESFVEDPLRLLRAVQFAARFELTPDAELIALARAMMRRGVLRELPRERIFEEWRKLLLKAGRPSRGLRLMDEMYITPFFPELHALKGVPMDPSNHAEGDVWQHTMLAVDAMASQLDGAARSDALTLMLAVLCHDMGRVCCTRLQGGCITAPGHAALGEVRARRFLARLTEDKRLVRNVLTYVRYHGIPKQLYRENAADAQILQLACHVRIDALALISTADQLGRLPAPETAEAAVWLTDRAKALGVLHTPRKALLSGNDLVERGLDPSPRFKTVLDAAYDAQSEGRFTERAGALKWLETYLRDFGKS